MKEASALFRLLGDEAPLRLLRVLAQDRFNVTELTGILGLAQSGISRHLGLLKDAGLVAEERSGAFSYYRLAAGVRENGNGALWSVLESQFAESDAAPRSVPMRRACRKCFACAAKTSMRTPALTRATAGNWFPGEVGRRGRERSGT